MGREALIRVAHIGMHPDRLRELLDKLGSAERVLDAVIRGAIQVPPRARAAAMVPADERIESAARAGLRLLVKGEGSFPASLAGLPDAPDFLFCRGDPPQALGVALVGTRKATRYGLDIAATFGRAVGEAGWPVVSGLARGVDGAAHRGTVEASAVGVAVLGCGMDLCYPPEHRELREQLIELGGCVLSEYPSGTPPTGWRFPPRNRIISGLSAAVVVIEARVDGGALITARRGLEQGRDIFAVPGDIDRPTSEGCNLLIQDGAHPVLGRDDLIETVGRVLGPPRKATGDEDGSPVLAHLSSVGRHADDLAAELGWTAPEILAELARLEARGRIAWDGGLATIR